jgi:hypothetical protein
MRGGVEVSSGPPASSRLMIFPFLLLSPLGERLGEGVMQEVIFAFHPLT